MARIFKISLSFLLVLNTFPNLIIAEDFSKIKENPSQSDTATDLESIEEVPTGIVTNNEKNEKTQQETSPTPAVLPQYVLEKIVVKGNTKTLRGTILHYISIKEGYSFSPDDPRIEKSRIKLLSTGWFSNVKFSLEKGSKKGFAILVVTVEERSTLLLSNLLIGNSSITPYGGLEITERNFLGRGLSLSGSFVAGGPGKGMQIEFFDPSIKSSPFSFGTSIHYSSGLDYLGDSSALSIYKDSLDVIKGPARIDYTRIGGAIKGSYILPMSLRLTLKYRYEYIDAILPIVAIQTTGEKTKPLNFGIVSGKSHLSTISAVISYDSRNDPFLPCEGVNFGISFELSNSIFGSSYNYSKYTTYFEWLKKLKWSHVLKLGISAGLIAGSAPFFEKFYIGDLSDLIPQRILGLSFDRRKSFNLLNTNINSMRYETIAAKIFIEYIIPLYRKNRGIYGIDFFFSAGLFMLASPEDFEITPSNDGSQKFVPLDITGNTGFRIDTQAGFFEISVATLLSLIPVEEELTLWR